MISFLEKLLGFIYSKKCFICNSANEDSIICSKCSKKITYLPPSVLKEIEGCKVFSCSLYDDVIKQLIKDLKYKKKKNLAKLQAKIMFEYFKKIQITKDFLILSVPIHKNRRKERKYNHMELVAEELTRLTGLKNNKKFLIRIKDTEKQFKLNKKGRIENLKNAFALNKYENIDKDKSLLIIDDITSTGATLEEIIKLLKQNGYNNITAITLATPDIWNTTQSAIPILK